MPRVGISAAERALIKGCAENGVGIDYIGDHAPRFRFVPAKRSSDPYQGREDSKPSSRGSTVTPCQPWAKKLKGWKPSRMSLDPMYGQPMRGDDCELTEARRCYANGNPAPLRAWLAEDCARRRLGL